MKNNKKTMAISCTLAFALSGCALTDKIKKEFTDEEITTSEGALTGAIIGGVAAAALGGKKEHILLGVALGGAIGAMFSQHVSKKKAEYADNESYMKAVIGESDKMIVLSRQEREKLLVSIKEQEVALDSLKTAQSDQQEVNVKLVAQRQQLNTSLARTNKLIAIIDQEMTIQKEVLEAEREGLSMVLVTHSETNLTALGTEKQLLEKDKLALEKLASQLDSLDHRKLY
jgi:outer membrane lipoprotein SlyB